MLSAGPCSSRFTITVIAVVVIIIIINPFETLKYYYLLSSNFTSREMVAFLPRYQPAHWAACSEVLVFHLPHVVQQ